MIDFAKLTAPFSPDDIHWRVGATNKDKTKGMALAYIDARAVMERLDAVCGPENWQCRYPHANGKTVCEIGLYMGVGNSALTSPPQWIWKADGAGDTDHEAEKGALSDAFKRSAVRWGIGRYLYDLTSPWVEIEQYGKSYKIKDSEQPKLRKLLGGGQAAPSTGRSQEPSPPVSPPPTKQTPLEWCEAQMSALSKMSGGGELDAWLDTFSEALERLQDKHPALYERVQGAYEKAKKDVATLNNTMAA